MSERARIGEGIRALKSDLTGPGGPQISTMRNYRFAIFQYAAEEEFELRKQMRSMCGELQAEGWGVLSIDLLTLLVDRLRKEGDRFVQRVIERERALFQDDPARALDYVKDKIADQIDAPEGIAADVIAKIADFADRYPEQADRTLVLIGRAGALYKFLRSSALLRHIDGKTRGIPVVLLYPGTRVQNAGLSFMGVVPADGDYRPRIYP